MNTGISDAGAEGEGASASTARRHRGLSLWWDQLPEGALGHRRRLESDIDVDVAIVGAGFTGLWTAHALLVADPSIRIALLEREVAGFGASGRNGGWCSALFAASDSRIAREHGPEAARAMRRAMQATVLEVGRTASEEGIDCAYKRGGTIVAARNAAQVERAMSEVSEARGLGFGEEDLRWLGPDEARSILGGTGVLGGTYTPHCAAIDPARLVRGLAQAVERRGAVIYESSAATGIEEGAAGRRPSVRTDRATVRSDVVVRAVEGWSGALEGSRRGVVPVYSLMIATEPLSEEFWGEAGLSRRETFSDHRHLIIYGQRTADRRIAFGGRGAPYHFASSIQQRYDRSGRVHEGLHATLLALLPQLNGAKVTHAWGGPLGVPRDWFSSVGLDPEKGVAWAGGYVGDGVSTSNLAGRTLADLILRRDTELVRLPWVGHVSKKWEPEPIRWLGINAALMATRLADRSEERRGRPSRAAAKIERLLGR